MAALYRGSKPPGGNQRSAGPAAEDTWGSSDRCQTAYSDRTSIRGKTESAGSAGSLGTIPRAVVHLSLFLLDRLQSHVQNSATRNLGLALALKKLASGFRYTYSFRRYSNPKDIQSERKGHIYGFPGSGLRSFESAAILE